jgi:hypothetical protein
MVHSTLYQGQMVQAHGFQLIGYLLTNAGGPPHDCTGVTIMRLEKLAASVSSIEQLFCHFFLHIYFNFDIWIHCDPAVQRELVQALQAHVKQRPQVCMHAPGCTCVCVCVSGASSDTLMGLVFPRPDLDPTSS